MLSPYDVRTEKVRQAITEDIPYYTNKYYPVKGVKDTYWYINQRGYLHIIRPCKVNMNGKFLHYEISDVLLTPDNRLKEVNTFGCFKTIAEFSDHIKENLAYFSGRDGKNHA